MKKIPTDLSKLDLSTLSREEKIQLYEMLQQKKKRERARRDVYAPHAGQLRVHANDKPNRFVFAGNGFGKTTCAVNEMLWAALGYNPVKEKRTVVPCNVIVVLDKPEKVDQTWLPEIRKWYNLDDQCKLEKKGKPYISQITFPNGSLVTFMFHQMEPMSFESIEASVVIFDEPPPKKIFVALKRGMRTAGTDPWVLLIGTPLAAPWLRIEIYEPWSRGKLPNVDCIRGSTIENIGNLAEGYIEEFSSFLSDQEKRIRLEGEFFDLEGLALAHLFSRDSHVIPPKKLSTANPCVVVIDPHPAKDHVACLLAADKAGTIYYVKEINSASAPNEFAKELREFARGYRIIDWVCDSLGETPGTGGDGNMSFSEKLREQGIPVRSTEFKEKSDHDFIQRIKQVLQLPSGQDNFGRKLVPKLQIFEGNNGIISDIENVQWKKNRLTDVYQEKLDISHKDFLACLKYGLATNLVYIAQHGRRPPVLKSRGRSPWSNTKLKDVL